MKDTIKTGEVYFELNWKPLPKHKSLFNRVLPKHKTLFKCVLPKHKTLFKLYCQNTRAYFSV